VNYIDPSGLDAIIALYPGANPFGHVGIGINTTDTVGFYPNEEFTPTDIITGRPVSGNVMPDTGTPISIVRIPTTSAQDSAMQNFINQAIVDQANLKPRRYVASQNNCSDFVQDVLMSAGVQTPNTLFPGVLIKFLRGISK